MEGKRKKYMGDLMIENTYMSMVDKQSPINRRTIAKKALKAYIRGKESFKYKGETYPVLYMWVNEEDY